ncbi:hypothetical protein AOLI_G00331030 [Acnodon oligacanthus]
MSLEKQRGVQRMTQCDGREQRVTVSGSGSGSGDFQTALRLCRVWRYWVTLKEDMRLRHVKLQSKQFKAAQHSQRVLIAGSLGGLDDHIQSDHVHQLEWRFPVRAYKTVKDNTRNKQREGNSECEKFQELPLSVLSCVTTKELCLKMLGCGCVLLSCLLTVMLFNCSVESLRLTQENPEYVESAPADSHGGQRGPAVQKTSKSVNAKLLLLDQLLNLENDVIETKRKRSFSGSNAPLDRLSISTMDPKSTKQRYKETNAQII